MVPDVLTGGPRFAAFCEHYVRQTKGRWSNRPMTLEGWQREFWWEALELDPLTGLRVYSEVGLGIPTKNGKSTVGAAGALYGLTMDGGPQGPENEPEVYIGAATQKQASAIVLRQARSMALRSPALARLLVTHAHRIDCPRNGGILRAVAADGPQQHGLNPSWNVIDEIHAHKDDGLYTALTKSGAARDQTFTNWITTGGPDEESLLNDLYGQMFAGTGELEQRGSLLIYRDKPNGILIFWYGAPRGSDPHDPKVWLECNPASWLQDGRWLAKTHGAMVARGALLEWQIYHLNQIVPAIESWLPAGAFAECQGDLDLRGDLPIGVGVFRKADASQAAVAIAQRQGERMVLRWQPFMASSSGRFSTVALRDFLRELRSKYPKPAARHPKLKYPLAGPAFAFERWQFDETADELEGAGLNMVDFPQVSSTMGPASTTAYEQITRKLVVHDGDRQLVEQMDRSQAMLTDRGMRVVPSRTGASNAGAIAAIMAIAMAMEPAPQPVQRARVSHGF